MLAQKSVLIVEDEYLIATHLEDMLRDLGCGSIALVKVVSSAAEMMDGSNFDLVVLDLNLDGTSALPIAEPARWKNIPIIFSSGYDKDALDEVWRKYPLLTKPYDAIQLQAKVGQALAMRGL